MDEVEVFGRIVSEVGFDRMEEVVLGESSVSGESVRRGWVIVEVG